MNNTKEEQGSQQIETIEDAVYTLIGGKLPAEKSIKIGFGYIDGDGDAGQAALAMATNIKESFKVLLPKVVRLIIKRKQKQTKDEKRKSLKIPEATIQNAISALNGQLKLIPIKINRGELEKVEPKTSWYSLDRWRGSKQPSKDEPTTNESQDESIMDNSQNESIIDDSQNESTINDSQDESIMNDNQDESINNSQNKESEKYDLVYWFIDNKNLAGYTIPSTYSENNILINVRTNSVNMLRRVSGFNGNNYKASVAGKNLGMKDEPNKKYYADYWCASDNKGEELVANCSKSLNDGNVLSVLKKALENMIFTRYKAHGEGLTKKQMAMIALVLSAFGGLGACYFMTGGGSECINFLRQSASSIFDTLFKEGGVVNTVGNYLWEKLLAPIGSAAMQLFGMTFDGTFKGAMVLMLKLLGANINIFAALAIIDALRNQLGKFEYLQFLVVKKVLDARGNTVIEMPDGIIPGFGDLFFSFMLYMVGGPWLVSANLAQKQLVKILEHGNNTIQTPPALDSVKEMISKIINAIAYVSKAPTKTIDWVIYTMLAMPVYVFFFATIRAKSNERLSARFLRAVREADVHIRNYEIHQPYIPEDIDNPRPREFNVLGKQFYTIIAYYMYYI
jgi:hypothetical protein